MVAMDVAAENATELPRLGSPRQKLRVQASHTVQPKIQISTEALKQDKEMIDRFEQVICVCYRPCGRTCVPGSHRRERMRTSCGCSTL